jgi:GT2 family glycosyltransferase
MRPLVSFITVNYNHLTDTIEFLESAQRLSYPNIEVIVVDNDSPKKEERPTPELIARFPKVKFIQSDKNLGFAGGNNLGLKAARGHYLFLLNNDTVMPEGFLEPIIDFMEGHPDAGMASPKVLYPDGRTLQYAGAVAISPLTGRGKRLGLFEKDDGQYDKNYQTDLGHGAALIVTRKAFEAVGLMPEIYFLYYEEHDWVEQMKRNGFNMYYIGTTHIIHKESVSTGGDESPLKVYYLTRNRLIFMRRNSSGIPFVSGVLFFVFIAAPRNILKYALKGKMPLVKSFIKGVRWNIGSGKV